MPLKVFKANKDDLVDLFNLANDPLVRKNSFNKKEITMAEHKHWFGNQIDSNNSLILIAKKDGKFVGVVKFKLEDENIIGISIAKYFRGKGLSNSVLTEAIEYLKKDRPEIKIITALIKEENIASVKTFEKSGFKFDQKIKVNESPSLKYIYEI
ncbi:TPA: GNAT family N-acetyltransferase [Candidatus Berkelbacteria bacterium]|uniref:Acetyltransferase, GNAT family n=1 Tax=Berkelbacteria bacterium GW2011_GWE1_39_12 TaxID=1618337 RepID=A0A0G4B2S9_9BACT|nr:MAG: acetyltransferase, GNAT family [Berkelbacteria bacterium GW2011_GWE1_39_12]HBO60782.1 GNAT family N-acetyltransferase [Candidatus Berkelbacteria bacterium]